MRIKLLKTLNQIGRGAILPVRKISKDEKDASIYQVIEGPHIGTILNSWSNDFLEMDDEEKKYTEKQWNDLENYYLAKLDKERESKELMQGLLQQSTMTINRKNVEIEKLQEEVKRLKIPQAPTVINVNINTAIKELDPATLWSVFSKELEKAIQKNG